MTQKSFHIDGLSCDHCVNKVTNALGNFQGVQYVKVFREENLIKLDAEPMPAMQELNELLEDYGDYKLSEI